MTPIQQLYLKIPNSTCKEGCSNCCRDFVQAAPEELLRIGGYDYNGTCPHLENGKCKVYEDRPLVCRIFGASEILACDGCTPDRYLTEAETMEIIREFLRLKRYQEKQY